VVSVTARHRATHVDTLLLGREPGTYLHRVTVLLSWAHGYACRGWPVFALAEGTNVPRCPRLWGVTAFGMPPATLTLST